MSILHSIFLGYEHFSCIDDQKAQYEQKQNMLGTIFQLDVLTL